MPYILSPSTLELMKECPRCFWLHFNKKIKRPEQIFPSLPSGMDRILKKHFDNFMEIDKLPPELERYEECKKLTLFKNKRLLEIWRNPRKGIRFEDENGNILRGAIDNLLKNKEKIIVLDYKTRGYELKETTPNYYKDQLDIYNFLLRKNGYETEDYSYLLFYYPEEVNKRGNIVFNTKLLKIQVNTKNAEEIWKKALSILSGDIPESSENCQFCKWARKVA